MNPVDLKRNYIIIGFSGTSGTGKSSVIKKHIIPYYETNKNLNYTVIIQVFHVDDFFLRSSAALIKEIPGKRNLETPESIDIDKFYQSFEDYIENIEKSKDKEKNKKYIVIVDCFLLFQFPRIVDKVKFCFFFFAEKETCLQRRRGRRKRNIDLDMFYKYYNNYVWEYYIKYHKDIINKIDNYRRKWRSNDINEKELVLFEVDKDLFAVNTNDINVKEVFVCIKPIIERYFLKIGIERK